MIDIMAIVSIVILVLVSLIVRAVLLITVIMVMGSRRNRLRNKHAAKLVPAPKSMLHFTQMSRQKQGQPRLLQA